jgi:hypothetical protein
MSNCKRNDPELASQLCRMSNEELRHYTKIHISNDSQDLINELLSRMEKEQENIIENEQ